MRYLIPILLVLSLHGFLDARMDENWQLDFDKARASALEEDKLMLLYFTGSDWCQWCNKLDNELFDDATFREGIGEIAVCVVLDFPQRSLPPHQERHNRTLKSKMKVEAIPEIVLYDPEKEKVLWRHGYLSVAPDQYLNALKAWRKTSDE